VTATDGTPTPFKADKENWGEITGRSPSKDKGEKKKMPLGKKLTEGEKRGEKEIKKLVS